MEMHFKNSHWYEVEGFQLNLIALVGERLRVISESTGNDELLILGLTLASAVNAEKAVEE